MIKLIVFDIDNTLALPNQPVDEQLVQQLRLIESQGIRIALISGKPSCYISGLARQLGLARPIIIGENGAILYLSATFPPEKEISMVSIEEQSILLPLIESVKKKLIERFADTIWLQPNLINLTIFPKLPNKNTLSSIRLYVEEILGGDSKFMIYQHSDSLEIVPQTINKGIAFKKILEIEKINKDETIAVGDGENDIPMLNEAGCSIGINLPQAQYNFTSIDEAMRFILSKISILDDPGKERELIKLEYEQVCNDWRHRDAMLWSILVIAITLAGVIIGLLEKNLKAEDKLVIYLLVLIFNIASLVKITKDHYYQLGSTELMNKMFPNWKEILTIDDNPRIHKPTNNFIKEHKDIIPLFRIYNYIAKQSAFDLLYIIEIGLIAIMIELIITTIMSFI